MATTMHDDLAVLYNILYHARLRRGHGVDPPIDATEEDPEERFAVEASLVLSPTARAQQGSTDAE
jgi:hypothetical protein